MTEMKNIKDEALETLRQMYDLRELSSLMEFCQGELRTLNYLISLPEAKGFPSDISDSLRVSRARTTATLSALRRKNYVSMDICSEDRRKVTVRVTEQGKKYLKTRLDEAEFFFSVFVERMGEENARDLVRLLRLAYENAKAMGTNG